jgi:Rieske Fe-S protein
MQTKSAAPILLAACLIISSAEAKDGQEADPDSLRNPLKNLVIDVRSIQPGQRLVVAWGMYPVWIIRRSDNELSMLAKEDSATLGDPTGKNWRSSFVRAYDVDPLLPRLLELDQVALEETPYRSLRKDIFVLINVNPTSGCSMNYMPLGAFPTWAGGIYDECSHQFYDLAGRVLKLNSSKGISADTQDASGNRALVIAALKGHNQIVQYLLAHGASPNLPNKKCVTPQAS